MKKITIFITLFPIILFAQKENLQIKKYKVTCLYIQPGGFFEKRNSASFQDFHRLIPQSKILTTQLNNYTFNKGDSNVGFFYSASIGINKESSEKKINPEFRLGLIYNTSTILQGYYSKEEKGGTDSVVSNNTTDYIDTTHFKSILLELKNQQLKLEASLLLRKFLDSRSSFYGGIGFQIGTLFNSNAHIAYNSYSEASLRSAAKNTDVSPFNLNEVNLSESAKLKNSFVATLYLPLGVDYALYERVHFIGEFRPYLKMNTISELSKTVTAAGLGTSLGIKVNF